MQSSDIDLRCELMPVDEKRYVCNICGKVIDKTNLDSPDINFCHQKLAMAAVREDIPQVRLKSVGDNIDNKTENKSIYHQIWNNHPTIARPVVQVNTDKASTKEINNNRPKCTQEQIDARLAVCHSCEFYKDNTCMKCGCALSREKNYMNKLFFADQKCPIDKWQALI